jgi:hypothetical protein
LHSHPLKQICQRLRGENCLLAVAGAVQADNYAISHERIVADALDRRDVPNVNSAGPIFSGRADGKRESQSCEQHDDE